MLPQQSKLKKASEASLQDSEGFLTYLRSTMWPCERKGRVRVMALDEITAWCVDIFFFGNRRGRSVAKEWTGNLDGEVSGELVCDVGKALVLLKCDVCKVILTYIVTFTTRVNKLRRDSKQEKSKTFLCETSQQGFYLQSSPDSHKSKAHLEIPGETFWCPFCLFATNSKNGMRRQP